MKAEEQGADVSTGVVSDSDNARLGKCRRLRRSVDFHRLYDIGRRAPGKYMVACWLPAYPGKLSRLGVVAGKKHGNAVRRARIKRILREVFRKLRHELAVPVDLVLLPRRWKTEPSWDRLVDDFRTIARKMNAEAGSG